MAWARCEWKGLGEKVRGQGRRDETEQREEKGREIQRQRLRDGDQERQEMQGRPKPWGSAKEIQREEEG